MLQCQIVFTGLFLLLSRQPLFHTYACSVLPTDIHCHNHSIIPLYWTAQHWAVILWCCVLISILSDKNYMLSIKSSKTFSNSTPLPAASFYFYFKFCALVAAFPSEAEHCSFEVCKRLCWDFNGIALTL